MAPRVYLLKMSPFPNRPERLIQQRLGHLMGGRTSFVMAHRPSTISRAGLIVVIEHGSITQTGSHAELMSKGGKYRSMVEQQIHMTLGSFITAMKIDGGCNYEVNFRR